MRQKKYGRKPALWLLLLLLCFLTGCSGKAPGTETEKAAGDDALQEALPERKTGDDTEQEVLPEKETGDSAKQEALTEKETGDSAKQEVLTQKETGNDAAQEESTEKKTGDYVAKEVLTESGPVQDDDALYAQQEDTSVVTMYLTICEGNEADNTDHTWEEINQYSTYYYEENGLARYNVDAILQIGDENGPVEGEVGFAETIPNAAVQIRGQTSSHMEQKNYKVRIKEGKGEWRGQRTIALNKHMGDPVRFRNKLAYDLLRKIPQLMSARTQFVHLYVKDRASGKEEFEDYGLYTQVEQINKTYLKSHGLDSKGHLYKVNFFEWYPYEALMKLPSDADYDVEAFESYLEIKGDDDHRKLQKVMQKLQDYSLSIEEILEEHFDVDNLCYWMAFHILIGNYDAGDRNAYLYSPLNSEKWYYITWDSDSAFSRNYYRSTGYTEGASWERGLTQFLHIQLFKRMLQEEKYRDALSAAVEDLKKSCLTRETVDEMVHSYAETVKPFVCRMPDREYMRVDEEAYDRLVDKMASEIDENYRYYKESLEKPWPFFVGVPEREGNELQFVWDISYDYDGENITYHFVLASDWEFKQVIAEEEGIRIPQITVEALPPGQYYVRVQAENESGYTQDCFDYYSVDGVGKVYGCKTFFVDESGTAHDGIIEESES